MTIDNIRALSVHVSNSRAYNREANTERAKGETDTSTVTNAGASPTLLEIGKETEHLSGTVNQQNPTDVHI